MVNAGEIIRNSIKINQLAPRKSEIDESYILIGAAKDSNGEFHIVRSVVNRVINELTSMDVLYAINAKKEESQLINAKSSDVTAKTGSADSSIEIIPQNSNSVNKKFSDRDPDAAIRYSDKPFGSQVDAVLNGSDTSSSHLKLMETPQLLTEAGLPNLPILMTAKHLKTITATEGTGRENYHGLSVATVKKLPEYISHPVMIADSLTRNDSIVIITEAIDNENRPVIAAILLNGGGKMDGKHIKANIMTSAYGRNNFQSFLNRISENDAVIYWDKQKSQDLSVSLGIQFPNAITSLDSNIIIHQASAFVNKKNSESAKKYQDRDPDASYTNRSLLLNALKTTAQNPRERALLGHTNKMNIS